MHFKATCNELVSVLDSIKNKSAYFVSFNREGGALVDGENRIKPLKKTDT